MKSILIPGAVLLGIAFPIVLLLHAHASNNGIDSFPLDDAWIHLTYARALHDHHTFAYTTGETATQGSTSPLYTLLLSLGFGFTRSEKTLSYVLGMIFQLGFLAAVAAWARRRLGGAAWAAVAVLLVALDGRIGPLAVSGMETSLFLFLVALTFHGIAARRHWQTSLALGLAVWTRPDGLLLLAIVAGGHLLDRWLARRGPAIVAPRGDGHRNRWRVGPLPAWSAGLLPVLLLLAAYVVFNFAIGGGPLPNTLGAKRAYYAVSSRAIFLRAYVPPAFLSGAWIVLLPFGLAMIARTAHRLIRGETEGLKVEAGWVLALPLAYLVLLPHTHRFSRYLMPAIPALCILGLDGIRRSAAWWRARRAAPARASLAGIATGGLLALALSAQGVAAVKGGAFYGEMCRYHWMRHERTGRWLAQNTPPDAVIAAHDVGAIAFYSGRRVVDMLGVVKPEVIPHVHRPDYLPYINALFSREHVTHLVVLRNWWEVVNVEPLFVADPAPEVMEVFPWIPGRTHIMPEQASLLDRRAAGALRQENPAAALEPLARSLALDPESSRTWLLAGAAREQARQWNEAEVAYRRALALFPEMADARFRLAIVLRQLGRSAEAREELRTVRERLPDYPGAAELDRALRD
jgi:hypothetical protein